MMYWGNHMTTGGWILSILGTLIIIGFIVGAIMWLASTARNPTDDRVSPTETAREVLDRRLASDEITPAHYDELRESLQESEASSNHEAASHIGTPS
jgi:uncharacterized membrane protein